MTEEVAVTGLGAVTAAGAGVAACWAAVRAGRGLERPDPRLAGQASCSCRVPGFDPGALLGAAVARRADRFSQFALVAAAEAVRDAGLDPQGWDGARVAVLIGSAFGGAAGWAEHGRRLARGGTVGPLAVPLMMTNMAAGQLSLLLGARGPSLAVGTACASGATALALGRDLLRSGACDLVLAGGAEAPVDPLTAAAFARMDALADGPCRPFDRARTGFVLGEGAAVLVLERAADARARGARAHALLLGAGSSADAHHLTTPHPDGSGLELAVRRALQQAGAAPGDVDHVNAHATGTRLGDLAEARALRRVCGPEAVVTATKGALGHTLGAAGAIEAVVTVLTVAQGIVPPIAHLDRPDPAIELDLVRGTERRVRSRLALSTSAGFGGQNAALLFGPASGPAALVGQSFDRGHTLPA
ncbi:beta-ketoacyl-[acyl-carrier-protein] synthase family protein [Kitasatospora sp. NPDC006697]|uniref:beta-ketoacyl-[acyl-carrier-protein] synthase family protein n=1 Tax=Kitasatospora sp. NPDC006697 TaxID=3364020 RepID=UPI0036827A62